MIQSQINCNIRLDLADAILLSKAKKDLSFVEIADGTCLLYTSPSPRDA